MAFMKYLTPFSGKEDLESWLESYQAAAKSEQWSGTQMLECISLKLRKKAKEWYTNLSSQVKPKTWEQFITLFLEEFSDEDLQTTLAKCYKIGQRKSESLKNYFNRFQRYLKKHETAVKREVAMRYAKKLMDKAQKPLSSDSDDAKKEKDAFTEGQTQNLMMSEDNRVEAFISGLRHYRSHFLITRPSTMEEVRQTVLHITRKRQWNASTKSNSDSDSEDNDSCSEESSEDSSKEEDFIKMKSKLIKNKGDNKSINLATKPQLGELDELIKQFGEMKIMLAEAVSKVDKLEQNKSYLSCKNCRNTDHHTQNCPNPCKNCQGSLGIHPFWKCPNYKNPNNFNNSLVVNQPVSNTAAAGPIISKPAGLTAEHVLLEDDDSDFYSTTLEDLFAYEENTNTEKPSKKRVRVEDIDDTDEDQVRMVNVKSLSEPNVTQQKKKRASRPRKPTQKRQDLLLQTKRQLN